MCASYSVSFDIQTENNQYFILATKLNLVGGFRLNLPIFKMLAFSYNIVSSLRFKTATLLRKKAITET